MHLDDAQPSALENLSRPAPSAPTGRKAPPVTILLVEDELLIRVALARFLQAAGYEVLAARSAEQALELVEQSTATIGVLVSDVQLPGLSGPELLVRLRERGLQFPVLFMSAFSKEMLVEQGRLLPEMQAITKPFLEEELLTRIHHVRGTRP